MDKEKEKEKRRIKLIINCNRLAIDTNSWPSFTLSFSKNYYDPKVHRIMSAFLNMFFFKRQKLLNKFILTVLGDSRVLNYSTQNVEPAGRLIQLEISCFIEMEIFWLYRQTWLHILSRVVLGTRKVKLGQSSILQSGILERIEDVLLSYYVYLVRWRVEMRVSYFIFYKPDVFTLYSIFCY